MTAKVEVGQKWRSHQQWPVYQVTVEAVHADNTGGRRDTGVDLIVLREEDGSLFSLIRVDFVALYELPALVWDVGHKYRAIGGAVSFTVTAVDPDGNALVHYDDSWFGHRVAGGRPNYEELQQ